MIRNIAFTFGFVFLSVAMVSQSADAQNYRSGCYCQQPVQVVQTFATPQPVQYYQMIPQQVAQPVTTIYGSVAPTPVFYNSVGLFHSQFILIFTELVFQMRSQMEFQMRSQLNIQ